MNKNDGESHSSVQYIIYEKTVNCVNGEWNWAFADDKNFFVIILDLDKF